MPQHRPAWIAALALVLGPLCAAPTLQAQSPQLTAVLAQMDTASRSFHNASADFTAEIVSKVAGISDTTKQRGSIFIARDKGATDFGAALYDLSPGGSTTVPAKVVNYGNGALRVYTPAEKQVDRFNAGNNGNSLEGYFSLGFGGSGHDLAQAWQITDKGPVTLQEDGHPVKTEMLVLVSKDPNVRNNFSRVTLWIDPTRDISLKQVFDTPSGDERTAVYSNIRLNGKIDRKPYDIPTKGVTVVPH